MASTDDRAALELRLDDVHTQVLQLRGRVSALESELGPSPRDNERGSRGPMPPRPAPVQGDATSTSTSTWSTPAPGPAPAPVQGDATSTWSAPALARHTAPPAPPRSQLVVPEGAGAGDSPRDPTRILAATGGVAMLLGLVFFVAYAIEQDWLPPWLRFLGAALLSALLTLAAWPLARRGHQAVAGAVGGAGLGAWFSSWLVARHAHELVSGAGTLAALVLGAAACLLIADRLRLRSMAVLATLAACATPLLVAHLGAHLGELMVYQLAVVAGLIVLDGRRRWPELPTMALAATWMLGANWATHEFGPDNAGPFMLWSVVLLVVSAGSAWRLLLDQVELAESERVHGRARLLVAGLATWAAMAWTLAGAPQSLAIASLGLAAWHGLLAVILRRREQGQAPAEPAYSFLALAWLQVLVAGPLAVEGVSLAWWFVAMGVVALAVPGSLLGRARDPMMLVPAFAAVVWSVLGVDATLALLPAAAASVLPMAASVWPRGAAQDPRPRPLTALASLALWAAVVVSIGPSEVPTQLMWALAPIAVTAAFVCARPSAAGMQLAVAELALALFASLAAVAESHALRLSAGVGPQLVLAAPLVVLAALGVVLVARVHTGTKIDGGARSRLADFDVGPLGLVIAVMTGLALVLCVSTGVGLFGGAIGQVGYTLCAALTGLGLLVAGLRLDQASWRQLGLAVIAVAGVKVVLVDLATAAVVWRALSFIGIGAILIGGAFAYSRAQQRLGAAQPSR